MNPARRRKMVDRGHPSLSIVRQCALVGVSRSILYYRPRGRGTVPDARAGPAVLGDPLLPIPADDGLPGAAGYTGEPESGAAADAGHGAPGHLPTTENSQPALGVRVYPYLLGKAEITSLNQAWATDITYLPMERGFVYLVVVMDCHSRYVLSWRLSNTLEGGFAPSL